MQVAAVACRCRHGSVVAVGVGWEEDNRERENCMYTRAGKNKPK